MCHSIKGKSVRRTVHRTVTATVTVFLDGLSHDFHMDGSKTMIELLLEAE